MHDGVLHHETSIGLQAGDNGLVGILDEHPLEVRNTRVEASAAIHGTDQWQALALTDLKVLLAEGRSLMHDARSGIGTHVVGADDLERHALTI